MQTESKTRNWSFKPPSQRFRVLLFKALALDLANRDLSRLNEQAKMVKGKLRERMRTRESAVTRM